MNFQQNLSEMFKFNTDVPGCLASSSSPNTIPPILLAHGTPVSRPLSIVLYNKIFSLCSQGTNITHTDYF